MFPLDVITDRLRHGCQTMAYPNGAPPALPDRYLGGLRVDAGSCRDGCDRCVAVCPTQAITQPATTGATPGAGLEAPPRASASSEPLKLDLGRCLFCAACVEACPSGAIVATKDYRLAARRREDLELGGPGCEEVRLTQALDRQLLRLFGRSLRLRQVSAGGCNACEADTNVLGTIGWDLGRFGVQFVASPRHADGLLITGPVTQNMRLALEKTWAALPAPKLVIAVGACAIAGGPFVEHPQVNDGAAAVVPVDLYIPGCPPHPLTILDGLLRLLGKFDERAREASAP